MLNKFQLLSFITLILLFVSNVDANAQTGKIPPFRIMQPNGNEYRADNLPMGKPILIIYFSPDCDDCLAFMDKFIKQIGSFNKVSITMITYLPISEVAKFSTEYRIYKYGNIVVGTEAPTIFVRNYYNITKIPFVALYDKNGNKIVSYERNIPIMELKNKIKVLN